MKYIPAIADFHSIVQALDSRSKKLHSQVEWYKELEWLCILQAYVRNSYSTTINNAGIYQEVLKIEGLKNDPEFWIAMLHASGADVKTQVKLWYENPAESDPLRAAIQKLETGFGHQLWRLLKPHYLLLYKALVRISDFEPPDSALERITGDTFNFSISVFPSLFAPPPQKGRYGFICPDQRSAVLIFGFPLNVSPEVYGINKPWLKGGAFHFAARKYFSNLRPAFLPFTETEIAREIALLTWPGQTAEKIITDHFLFCLSALNGIRSGVPYKAFSVIAAARNLKLFDYFFNWFLEIRKQNIRFSDSFSLFVHDAGINFEEIEKLATAKPEFPPAINLLLMQRAQLAVRLRFPDVFDDRVKTEILERWSLLGATIFSTEAINQINVSFIIKANTDHDAADADLLVSLWQVSKEKNQWELQIVSGDIKAMADLPVEVLLQASYTKVLISSNRIVKGWGHVLQHAETMQPAIIF